MLRKISFILCLTLGLVGAGMFATRSLQAAPAASTITVNIQADGSDAIPNGVCETSPGNGACTLRAAIQEANYQAGAQKIIVPTGTFVLERVGQDDTALNGDLDIADELTLKGAGATNTIIDANGAVTLDRAIHILYKIKATISGVTIRGGKHGDYGGGIFSKGELTLTNSIVKLNYGYYGGGISNQGNGDLYNAKMTIINSTIESNSAETGGGIENGGAMTLRNSRVHSNSSHQGGGLRENNKQMSTIVNSIFSENNAYIRQDGWGGDGAGIYLSTHALTIVNSTFSANTARHHGGAIYIRGDFAETLNLLNVTVTENRANNQQSADGRGGGLYIETGATVTLANTILASNFLQPAGVAPKSHDCYGALVSQGYNLLGKDTLCSGLTNGANGDKVGTHLTPLSPKLEGLADNGGATRTHALQSDSPARDAGNPNGCADQDNAKLESDQRHFVRVVGAACDIGAFEFGSAPIPAACSTKPSAPSLVSPGNNAMKKKSKVKLDWTDANCATKYKVIVKQDSKSGPQVDKKNTTDSKYKTIALTNGHTYFWRIKACNAHGCTKSPTQSFKVK